MEKKEFSDIPLEETGFYNQGYSFAQAFKKHGITTVSQVLDDKTMWEYMTHATKGNRTQLMGFISLMKYKYLNLPIPAIQILEQNCDLSRLTKIGFSNLDYETIKRYLRIEREYIDIDINNLSNYKLIEVLQSVLTIPRCSDRIRSLIETSIECYEQNKTTIIPEQEKNKVETNTSSITEESKEKKMIIFLKEQLVGLTSMRDSLNIQINNIQQQIELLSNNETKSRGQK